MPSYKIELNSKPVHGTKVHKLLLRITVERKHARMVLDYSISPKQFIANPQKEYQHIRQSNPKHKSINKHIDEKIQEAKDTSFSLHKEGKSITAQSIKQRMLKPKSSSFIDFTTNHYVDLRRSGNIGNFKKYRALLHKIKDFVGEKDILFSDIDVQFLEDFNLFLKQEGNAQSTIHGRMKAIRALVYKAIDRGLIQQSQNPFFSYKLKSGKSNRSRLTEEEMKLIEDYKPNKEQLEWHVRNAFLFSYYCAGVRASDIILLKWKSLQNDRLIYEMLKTGKIHSIKLVKQAKDILSLYGPEKPDQYVFPFFKSDFDYSDAKFKHDQIVSKTALINKYLKDLATKVGIDKKISTHTARHSFADIARKKTDNIYNLSKTLGHSDLKTTETYLASFDEDVVDSTLDDVFDK